MNRRNLFLLFFQSWESKRQGVPPKQTKQKESRAPTRPTSQRIASLRLKKIRQMEDEESRLLREEEERELKRAEEEYEALES